VLFWAFFARGEQYMNRMLILALLVLLAGAGVLVAGSTAGPQHSVHADASGQDHIKSASLIVSAHEKECAQQAREQFHRLGWDSYAVASVAHHYSDKLKKCFIELDGMSKGAHEDQLMRSLGDATGREYATYISGEGGALCELVLPSGEVFDCHSLEEFTTIVREYMR
jgi:hypothetical protein